MPLCYIFYQIQCAQRQPEISTNEEVGEPYIGMQFETIEDAYEKYNSYAKATGFSVRNRGRRKSKKDDKLISKWFCCSKEGWKKENENVVNPRPSIRTGCQAMLQISLRSSVWVTTRFVKEHSHNLLSPSKVRCLRSQRIISKVVRSLINTLMDANLRPNQIINVLNHQHGGVDKLPFSSKDARNLINRDRMNIIKGIIYDYIYCYQLYSDELLFVNNYPYI